MSKFFIPGAFWVAIILALPAAITPIIQQFWPTAQYPIAAAVVVGIDLIVVGVKAAMTQSGGTPPPGVQGDVAQAKKPSLAKSLLLGL